MTLYRVPLNALVVAILLNSDAMGRRWTLVCCCGLLTTATALHLALRATLARRRKAQ